MINYLNNKEEQYFKCAQLTDQLDLCLRTINTRDETKNKIAITQLFYQLQDNIQTMLVNLDEHLNINLDEMPRTNLYRNINKVMHIETGVKYNSIADAKIKAPKELGDGYLTLFSSVISEDGKWKRTKEKVSWFDDDNSGNL